MVHYSLREAEKKVEYPLSPQHNWVTSVDIDIIQHCYLRRVCNDRLSSGYITLDFFMRKANLKEIQNDGGIRQLAI